MQKFSVGPMAGGSYDDDDIRELYDVDLYDVGPVTFPAYEATSAGLRVAELAGEVRSAWDAARQEHKVAHAWTPSAEFLRMRARLAEADG
jgi:phage head maturation protease